MRQVNSVAFWCPDFPRLGTGTYCLMFTARKKTLSPENHNQDPPLNWVGMLYECMRQREARAMFLITFKLCPERFLLMWLYPKHLLLLSVGLEF